MLTKCLLKSMLAFSMNSAVFPSESSRLQRSYSSVGFRISAAASVRQEMILFFLMLRDAKSRYDFSPKMFREDL